MNNNSLLDNIAIVGMACRFPGAKNLQEFWENLCEGRESITFFSEEELLAAGISLQEIQTPNYVAASPILENVDKFDAEFFEFSPREARLMDPQQRLLLEVSWEAFEDAGYPLETQSSIIGSFTGSGGLVSSYFVHHLARHPELLSSTGSLEHISNDKDFLSTRIAYKLNCTGPSINVQTACSTSMVALHLACQSILARECDIALVGASTVRFPHCSGYQYIKGDILSSDGHCRPFDARAEGTIFGSGVAAIIIKPLKKAIEDKDHIYAAIKSTSINNDGAFKISYTASSVDGQVNAIKKAFQKANIEPDSIGYVECHGTGTLMGDPLEIDALHRAFALSHTPKSCPIGSVKGNIGHLEQTSGLAGLIKTALIIKYGRIPPSIHYQTPNPKIPFDKTPFYVNTKLQSWPKAGNSRRACVNSLGLGGTNAFAILEQVVVPIEEEGTEKDKPIYSSLKSVEVNRQQTLALLTLSAKNSAALSDLKKQFSHYLLHTPPDNIKALCYSMSTGRTHFPCRAAYLAHSVTSLREAIVEDIQNASIEERDPQSKDLVFIFTGQGSQYPNMAKNLYETQAVFSSILKGCEALLRSHLEIPLTSVLYDADYQYLLNETLYTQPVLFALEYALAKLWESFGIVPAAVMGHSVGEYVAACVAGVFSLEEALSLIAKRARLMHELPDKGMMAAIFADKDTVSYLITQYSATDVNVAAINGPLNTVISGTKIAVHRFLKQCEEQGIAVHSLNVSTGFHSFLLDPMLSALTASAEQIKMNSPSIPWISNLTGEMVTDVLDSTYWARHAREPVLFQDGFLALERLGFKTFLEIGPGKTLTGMGKSIIQDKKARWLHSLTKDENNLDLLQTIRQLYLAGCSILWQAIYPNKMHRIVGLPLYPFQGQRYYLDTKPSLFSQHPLVSELKETPNDKLHFVTRFNLANMVYLNDHRMFQIPVMPTTVGIELVLTAGQKLLNTPNIIIENLLYERSISFLSAGDHNILCTCDKEHTHQARITLSSQNETHLSALVRSATDIVTDTFSLETIAATCSQEIAVDKFYATIAELGLNYGPHFRGIKKIWLGSQQALAKVELNLVPTDIHQYTINPAFLDACLHIYPALVDDYMDGDKEVYSEQKVYLPIGIEQFLLLKHHLKEAWVYAQRQEITPNGLLIVNIYLLDNNSQVLAFFKRITLRQLSIDDLKPAHYVDHLYQLAWQEQANLSSTTANSLRQGVWIIVANELQNANHLYERLTKQAWRCYSVIAGNTYRKMDENFWSINAEDPNQYEQLFQDIFKKEQLPLQGILYFPSTNHFHYTDASQLILEEKTVCGHALVLMQTMIKEKFASLPQTAASKLWIITKNAQFIPGMQQDIDLIQAELWGMGRTLALEYPNSWGGLIDIDKDDALIHAVEEIDSHTKEQQMVFRNHHRFVSRFVKVKDSHQNGTNKLLVKSDANYLITGGLGALGLCVAKWLVIHYGAKHLTLMGRHGSNPKADMLIKELQDQGVVVSIYKMDVTSASDVKALFTAMQEVTQPLLRGIIHCAGGLDDAVVNQMTWNKFVKVTQAKVLGGWLLHHYSKDLSLDFFILFSSILSLMGSPGQINYSAGNAFLDALGAYRRSLKLPILVLNWGPWAEVGLATHSGNRGETIWRRRGTEYIKPHEAMRLMEEAIRLNLDHAGITITNWNKFSEQFTQLPSFYTKLASTSLLNQTQLEALRDRFLKSDAASKPLIIDEILCDMIKELLSIDETIEKTLPLNEFGLDSLIAVELINQMEYIFKIRISAMDIIQGASIKVLREKIVSPLSITLKKTDNASSNWLVFHKNKLEAEAYLFCFPYAGGGPHVFKDWNEAIDKRIQTIAIHLPGRGARLNEKLPSSILGLAELLVEQLEPFWKKPFAFLGHSMGGLLMYELSLQLKSRGLPLPTYLYPSGVVAPHLYSIPRYHELNNSDLVEVLKKIDFKSTKVVLENEEVRQMVLPVIRSDLALAARYPEDCSGQHRLNIPILAFGGAEDAFAAASGISLWEGYTNRTFELRMLSGQHYFIETQLHKMANAINETFLEGN